MGRLNLGWLRLTAFATFDLARDTHPNSLRALSKIVPRLPPEAIERALAEGAKLTDRDAFALAMRGSADV